jgi:tRNA nucleotidyltransferase (CCA-adding enzyme)
MSDYNFLMESRLSPRQFQVVNQLAQAASAEGLNFYLVGGVVRDLTYRQQNIRDLDFAVEGNPERILRRLGHSHAAPRRATPVCLDPSEADRPQIEDVRFDRRLMSAEVRFTNGVRAELSQCRQEDYSRPGRPPEINPTTIFEDLRRRDFAMNAMAVSLHPNSRGLLLDPTNGGGDIEREEIRVLHSRSFYDDPSRIYRLLRLGQRLGFKPEQKTENWLRSALENQLYRHLTPEQQGRELEAILHEENPARALKLFTDRGLLGSLDRKITRVSYDRFHKIRSLAQKLPDADLFLLNFDCLVAQLGPSQRARLAKKIIRSPRAVKVALGLEREAKKLARILASSRAALPSQAWKLLSSQPETLLFYLLAYYPQPKIQTRLRNYLFKAPQVQARLPRLDLQTLGVNPGPKLEQILTQLFFDQLDGKIKTPQQLGKAMRSLAGIKEPAPKAAAVAPRDSKKLKSAASPGGTTRRQEKPQPRRDRPAPPAPPATRSAKKAGTAAPPSPSAKRSKHGR